MSSRNGLYGILSTPVKKGTWTTPEYCFTHWA